MKWLVLALLWGVALLNYLDRQVIFSLFPLLERDLHASTFELGLIGTVFLVTYGALSPFAGYLADRVGRVRVILISLMVWSAATWITGHVHSMPEMLGSRAIMGISEAFYLPAALALIADWHGPKTRSLATGLHQSGLYTGIVLGGAWGGWMGDHAGWRPVFQILGIVGAVYFLILLFALRDKPAAGRPSSDFVGAVGELVRSAAFLPLVLAFTAMAIANWLIYTWLPLFLYERFHMSLTNAGFSATFYVQAASYAGVIAGGIVSDRWSARNPAARVYCQMAGLLIAAPFLVLLGATSQQPLLVAALVAFGIGRGVFDCNTMPVVREVAPGHLSATAYGVLNMAGCLAGGIGAAAAGWLKQHLGLGAAFQVAALVLVLGALALLRAAPVQPRGKTTLSQTVPI
ncbi:MAG: major facilitator superfamily 1 [Bryobacterales bacterium]|nr:major facilitator superfamily 1 [Bryobacterales bacterium]